MQIVRVPHQSARRSFLDLDLAVQGEKSRCLAFKAVNLDHAWNLRRSRKLKIWNEGQLQFWLSRQIWVRKWSLEHNRELKGYSNLQEPKYSSTHQIVVKKDDSGRCNSQIKASSDPTGDFGYQQPHQPRQFAPLRSRWDGELTMLVLWMRCCALGSMFIGVQKVGLIPGCTLNRNKT